MTNNPNGQCFQGMSSLHNHSRETQSAEASRLFNHHSFVRESFTHGWSGTKGGIELEIRVYHVGAFIISMNRASVFETLHQPTRFIVDLIDTFQKYSTRYSARRIQYSNCVF